MKITVVPASDHSQLHCAMTFSPDELQALIWGFEELQKSIAEERAVLDAFPPPKGHEPKMFATRITGTTLPYTISLCMSPREKTRPPLLTKP
jgi:hypothetical protein